MINTTMMNTSHTNGPRSGWRIVRFIKPHRVAWGSLASGSYAPGETAGFPPDIAAKIVDTGAAVYVEKGPTTHRYRVK